MKKILAIVIVVSCFCSVASAVEDNCSENTSKISGIDSPSYNYFQHLLKRGERAPLKDFLKFWYPEKDIRDDEATYFFQCQNRPYGPLVNVSNYDFNQQLNSECSPDVLYSWGSLIKLNSMSTGLKNGLPWEGSPNPGRDNLYTSLTPYSTYAYGPYQVRLKIKPEVIYKTRNDHDEAGVINVRTTVFQEFVLNDASVIDSWSFGTPEQYDEIVRDILRIKSGKRAQMYYTYEEPHGWGIGRIFGNLADGVDDSEKTLKKNLLEHIRLIINGEGQINFTAGSCQNRKLHFATNKPTYFNPD